MQGLSGARVRWIGVSVLTLLLGACSSASMPDLEDVPPTAMASGDAQAAAGSAPSVELTPEQRTDIEQGVQRGLASPHSAAFGDMTARVSRFTSLSYIICGWVDPQGSGGNAGYQPFVAMYVPKTRNALLIGVGGRQPPSVIRQRCIDEGVPLSS